VICPLLAAREAPPYDGEQAGARREKWTKRAREGRDLSLADELSPGDGVHDQDYGSERAVELP
jgi:hypothetical protein